MPKQTPGYIRGRDDLEDGLAKLLEIDPRLKPLADATGPLPLRLGEPGFVGLAHIVVSQMVSRASAEAIWGRLLMAADGIITPQSFLDLDEATVRAIGLSVAKASALRLVARAVLDGELDLHGLSRLEAREAQARLIAFRGIGPWTAEVYLMFCVGHADIFPAGDVALRAAVGAAFGHPTRPDIATVQKLAAGWSPWRSVAARLFWALYATRVGREAVPL